MCAFVWFSLAMSADRSSALAVIAALAVIVTGCIGSLGAPAQGASGDGSPIPTATSRLLDPLGWDDDVDVPHACWLLEPQQLEERLGMDAAEGVNPFLATSVEHNSSLPLKNACQWKEPLYGEWTASEFVLVIHAPWESEFIEGEWARNEEWRLYLHDEDEQPLELVNRAWFDPGTSDAPNSITLDDGSTAIGAHATLYVEVGSLWLSFQPSGEAAVRPSVLADTVLLADEAVFRLVQLVLEPE